MSSNYPIRVLHRGMSNNKGGIETYIMNYYRHMNRNLVQFDFIVPQGMTIAYEDEISSMGGNIYKEIVGIKRDPIKGLLYDRLFFEKHPEISIIHINDCSAANLRLMKTAKKYGVQTRILHSHNNDYLVPLRKRQLRLEKYNKKHLQEIATDLFACSQDAGKFMFGSLPFRVIKNAIDTKDYIFSQEARERLRAELGISKKQTVIGCVARLDFQKNHEFLLKIFSEFRRLDSTSILVLVGDGPLRPTLEQKIVELQLSDAVIILGMRNDVPTLLNTFDLFVLPSKSEGLGIVLIEAQVNGLQCIASDHVPEEANILNNITYISLAQAASFWAQEMHRIICTGNKKRNVDLEIVREAGYAIQAKSEEEQEIYLNKKKVR